MRVRQRPDDETLRLALQLADEIGTSPGLAGPFSIDVDLDVPSFEVSEPVPRDLRDLLGLLRTFDMPSQDVELERLYEIVDRMGIDPSWADDYSSSKAAWRDRNMPGRPFAIHDPEKPPGPGVGSRRATPSTCGSMQR